VLHEWQFRWLADAVGNLPVQSISGGTDIVGCFLLGHPEAPVRPGRCQSLSLGLDVAAVDETGAEVVDEVGELVCRRPFPSRPVRFLGDPDGQRFHRAYFADHPGVWTHGDRVEIAADGSTRVYGRSDGVLNVDGVRIGPSEIYTIVRRLPEVADVMAVEQPDRDRPGSSRLALLVVLREPFVLDEALAARIRSTLRREGSAAHVPSLVLGVPELPMTHNGKKSERAARDALSGLPAANTSALRNPASVVEIAEAARRAERELEEAAPVEAADGVRGQVASAFRAVLGAPLDEATSFFDAGGTSRQSMTLLRRLRIETGREVSLEDFMDDPTIRGVTAAVRSAGAGTAAVSLLRSGDPALPGLYLVHGAYGDADSHWALVEHLNTPRPVYGLAGVLNDTNGVMLSLAEIAEADVERLTAAQPTGPLYLAGYSFGGLVAYEMARRFAARGREVAFLGLLDVVPPQRSLTGPERVAKKAAGALALMVPGLSNKTLKQAVTGAFRDYALPADERALQDATGSYESHRWGPYAGRVTYFRATRCIPVFGHLMHTWRRVAPDMEIIDVPCTHHDMMGAERAPALGRAMSAALARCESEAVSA
jgi:acetoacetyl-CoA synthetase